MTNWDLREVSGSTPVSSVVVISAPQRMCSLCVKRNVEVGMSDCLSLPFPKSGLARQPRKGFGF